MLQTKIFDSENKPSEKEKQEIITFLFDNLEQYGDPKKDIEKCMDYSLKNFTSFGGFTIVLKSENTIKGASIINQTGM